MARALAIPVRVHYIRVGDLLMAGHAVKVFDLAPAAMAQAVAAGGMAATSAVDAVAEADVVISMLPASRHVEGLYLGENGLLPHIPDGALVIDCSTIAPASVQKVAKAAVARGLSMIGASVSGGTTGAMAGMLTFISGAGQVVKLCNNMMLGAIMAVTDAGLALGVTYGLDARVLSQMMAVSTYRSQLGHRGVQPMARGVGKRAGVAGLHRWLRQRPYAEGPGPGRRSRDGRQRVNSARRTGAQLLCHEQSRRAWRVGLFQHCEVGGRECMNTSGREKLTLPGGGDRLLLHSCHAPCSGEVMEAFLASGIDYTVFFYNSTSIR